MLPGGFDFTLQSLLVMAPPLSCSIGWEYLSGQSGLSGQSDHPGQSSHLA